jgi:hypothetical protein
MPNVLYKNVEGRRFEDVSESSGTGHLQKGHGTSMADWDGDGDIDLFVEMGGAAPGDKAHNLLFQNPGHGRHWLKVRLVGTRTNRAAMGARLRLDVAGPGGETRSIYRAIGATSSFGNNSLVESFGLGQATSITSLTVTWPVSGTTQEFRDLEPDSAIEITEGDGDYRTIEFPYVSAKPGETRDDGPSPGGPAAPAL